MIQNGRLDVDVPGQMVFELNEPNEEGLWYFSITHDNKTSVSFEKDDTGKVKAMKLHQAFELPKKK